MVIVNVFDAPAQVIPPLVYFGVTVIKPEIAALVVLVVTKEAILPEPEPARPIAVLLFDQSYVVPDTKEPDKVIIEDELPLQKAIFVWSATVGVGFTVIVNDLGVPEQLCPPFE